MKRTRHSQPKVSAILTADWHLREDIPVCRTDNFWEAQWKKMDEVKALQQTFKCPVLHAGDLFNHWKPSPNLLSETIKHLPKRFYTIYGNHDLPQHNLELAYKSGVHTLERAGKLETMDDVHWGREPRGISSICCGTQTQQILVWHVMTYQGKLPWPRCKDPKSATLLRKYLEYDLILTGHNHKSFTETHEGHLLVNPGSLTRQAADQINHEPSVYLWYAEINTVKRVVLNYTKDVISREHIEVQEERNDRIDAFISRLDEDWEAAIGFEENLERFFQNNKVVPSVKQIVIDTMN